MEHPSINPPKMMSSIPLGVCVSLVAGGVQAVVVGWGDAVTGRSVIVQTRLPCIKGMFMGDGSTATASSITTNQYCVANPCSTYA